MATTFKMATVIVIFKRWSSLYVNCFKNGAGNFKIDCKSEIQLHYVIGFSRQYLHSVNF